MPVPNCPPAARPSSPAQPAHAPHPTGHVCSLLQEYGYLMCTIVLLVNLGVQGGPTGPLAGCPCCAGASSERPLHGICVDFNFTLTHLASRGSAHIQQPPPNHQLFLRDAATTALLLDSNAAAAAQTEAERACSDFNAARALARTSEKVCLPACRPAPRCSRAHHLCHLPPALQLLHLATESCQCGAISCVPLAQPCRSLISPLWAPLCAATPSWRTCWISAQASATSMLQ